jgi:hypothetical protein
MANEMIKVGVANKNATSLSIETLKTWVPTNINHFGTSVFFKWENVYYSMTRMDFKLVYNL